ncbi:hypothetical protein JVU11DRAFT_7169 [Chiua virens]|nr:hypothetical protein JVU11DRAFT_7169 [Chiua virens]
MLQSMSTVAAAKAKVAELNRSIYCGRRIRVELNSQPPGCFIPNLRLNAIKIHNLPPDVTDEDVIRFTRSQAAKRLRIKGTFTGTFPVEEVARLVRNDIEEAVPEGFLRFDDPLDTCTLDGIVYADAHFLSWDEAHAAWIRLSGQRYGEQSIWLQLPNPMNFTLVIPIEQYRAQKAHWDSLLDSTKDQQACTLHVREAGNVVRIQLSGSVKEATGAMRVRVENLARGEMVEGWHRLLGIPDNMFMSRVYAETGAYVRADLQRQSLKVFGSSTAVDQAREMIKNELARLAALDYSIILAPSSVGYFVREGLEQLKETLGEDNVRFETSSRRMTVSGSEEAQHALDRLVERSHEGKSRILNARRSNQTCPICYDDISSPHRLACGHTYCVACLHHYISSALESGQLPLFCLGDEAQCHVPIAIPTIQHFVPPATFNRLLEAAFDTYIAKHSEQFKHCKTPDCTQIYRAAEAGTTPQMLQCPSVSLTCVTLATMMLMMASHATKVEKPDIHWSKRAWTPGLYRNKDASRNAPNVLYPSRKSKGAIM